MSDECGRASRRALAAGAGAGGGRRLLVAIGGRREPRAADGRRTGNRSARSRCSAGGRAPATASRRYPSPILSVNAVDGTVEIQYELDFTAGDCEVQKAYLCHIVWKQVFGDNPAFVRQFSEGLALFKNTRFNIAEARFVTDFSSGEATVPLIGTGNSLWGLFGWGEAPWGGSSLPDNIRFLIPQDKQLGSSPHSLD